MSSSPKLLFCELTLNAANPSKSFNYAEKLPTDGIPPSYRGKAVKFNYNLLVGAQILNAQVQVVKVPFRVLSNNESLFSALRPLNASKKPVEEDDEEALSIANPFSTGGNVSGRHLMSDSLPPPTPHEVGGLFDIAVSSGRIAKLSLAKRSFKMGEEIVACLQFKDAVVQCVQYSAGLVAEEDVKGVKKSRLKVAKSHDFVLGYEESCLRLEIPLHATPSFSTSSCSLSWHLHFEFVVVPKEKSSALSSLEMCNEDGCEWNAPQKVAVQTLEWNLPIRIHGADPAHVEWIKRNKDDTTTTHKWIIKS